MLYVSCSMNGLQFAAFQQELPQTCERIGQCGKWEHKDIGFDLIIPLPKDDEELFFSFAAECNIVYVPVGGQ